MQGRVLEYSRRRRRLSLPWAVFLWPIGGMLLWMAIDFGAIVIYAHFHETRNWPTVPEWFPFDRIFWSGQVAALFGLLILGLNGKLPGTRTRQVEPTATEQDIQREGKGDIQL